MSDIDPLSQQQTAIMVEQDGILVCHAFLDPRLIPDACVSRSKLLQDIGAAHGTSGEATVPLAYDDFLAWIEHVQPACSAEKHEDTILERPGGSGTVSDERPAYIKHAERLATLRGLVNASDILIDDETQASAAAELANLLLPQLGAQDTWKADPVSLSVLNQLPDHLIRAVLSCVQLSTCLTHLPTYLHPPALSAHHPSIDTHRSLTLPPVPRIAVRNIAPALPAAVSAAATLTRLEHLSLAHATLPHGTTFCLLALRSLTALTALDLSDLGTPDDPTAAAAAIAALLCLLPRLHTLHLSDFPLTDPAMQALAPGLASCPALASLHLLRTLPAPLLGEHMHARVHLQGLARAVRALCGLTALSIGSINAFCRGTSSDTSPRGLIDLLAVLRCASALRDLNLDISGAAVPEQRKDEAARLLAGLTQLQRLTLAVPALGVQAVEDQMPDPSLYDVPTWRRAAMGRALAELTGLTALELNLYHVHPRSQQSDSVLWSIGFLTALRSLVVQPPNDHDRDGQVALALATVLPHLPQLTRLQCSQVEVGTAGHAAVLVDAAVAHPALRALHVGACLDPFRLFHPDEEGFIADPESQEASANELRADIARLLAALLAARRLEDLSLDMSCLVDEVAEMAPQWAQWEQLFPHVRLLAVDLGSESQLHRIEPLLSGFPALRTLHELHLTVPATYTRELAATMLRHAACLHSLRELAVCFLGGAWHDIYAGGPRSEFSEALQGLTALTALRWVHPIGSVEGTLRLTALGAALPQLQLLCVSDVVAEDPEAVAGALGRLALRTLCMHRSHAVPEAEMREIVAATLPRLPHLRRLETGARAWEHPQLRHAVSLLPAGRDFLSGRRYCGYMAY